MKRTKIVSVLLSIAIAIPSASLLLKQNKMLRADTSAGNAISDVTDEDIKIETSFPDENFRKIVSAFDTNGDGFLSQAERDAVTELKVSSKDIASLEGIQYFTSLTYLGSGYNQLQSLDLSKNTELTTLILRSNQLTSLDLSKNTKLETLNVNSNKLTALNLENCTKLTVLSCEINEITSINVSKCTNLVELHAYKNQIASLDVSGCASLSILNLEKNALTSLDISKNTKLTSLDLDYNTEMTSIDTADCPDLVKLSLQFTNMKSLDVTENPKLEALYIYYASGNYTSGISSIDLSKNSHLKDLSLIYCGNLTSLDLTNNPELEKFSSLGTKIEAVDVRNCAELTRFKVESSTLKEIDLSNNTKLQHLVLYGNKLTSVDVSHNPELTWIDISNNKDITSIDLSNNTKLNHFECSYTKIDKLDLSHNPDLHYLECDGTQITDLEIGSSPLLVDLYENVTPVDYEYSSSVYHYKSTTAQLIINKTVNITVSIPDDIPITAGYFPDPVLCEYVKQFDTKTDGLLSKAEREAVEEISIGAKGLADATGIEHFPKLKVFSCGTSKLTALDVSKNTELEGLYVSYNEISELDLSKNTALVKLDCYHNNLSTLDLSNNTSLTYLRASWNAFTQVDLSMLPGLTSLYLGYCKLESIDLSHNPELDYVDICKNQLQSVDVSHNTKLTTLDVWGNKQLTSIDITMLPLLTDFHCTDCNITSLDLSGNPVLDWLWCGGNPLGSLDLSHNPELRNLTTYRNGLTELDVSMCPKLVTLAVSYDHIGTLDVSMCPNLTYLECDDCGLTELDISNNPKLTTLEVENNALTTLDVTRASNLRNLKCYHNNLSEINISNCAILVDLVNTFPRKGTERYMYDDYEGSPQRFLYYDATTKLITDQPVVIEPDPPTPEPQPTTPEPQPDTPTPAPAKDPSFEDFVERLYVVALGRESEPEGKAFWVDQVVNKGFTGADCARFFMLGAPEFLGRNLTDDEFVEVLYKTYFDRDSEPEGKAYWMGRLASGEARAVLVEEFIESVEWCNVCATYGVKSGALYHKATIPSKNAVKFATRLYTCCLGRDPEEEGLSYWALALTNLDVSGYQAASLFFTLPEFVGLNTTNEEYLRRLYTTFMGRDPEADGFNYWLSMLNDGTDRVEVMKIFASCPEFQEICNQYGIVRGEI